MRETVLEQIKFMFTQALDHPDESTLSYYQQIINGALSDDEDGVEEIDLSGSYDNDNNK